MPRHNLRLGEDANLPFQPGLPDLDAFPIRSWNPMLPVPLKDQVLDVDVLADMGFASASERQIEAGALALKALFQRN